MQADYVQPASFTCKVSETDWFFSFSKVTTMYCSKSHSVGLGTQLSANQAAAQRLPDLGFHSPLRTATGGQMKKDVLPNITRSAWKYLGVLSWDSTQPNCLLELRFCQRWLLWSKGALIHHSSSSNDVLSPYSQIVTYPLIKQMTSNMLCSPVTEGCFISSLAWPELKMGTSVAGIHNACGIQLVHLFHGTLIPPNNVWWYSSKTTFSKLVLISPSSSAKICHTDKKKKKDLFVDLHSTPLDPHYYFLVMQ